MRLILLTSFLFLAGCVSLSPIVKTEKLDCGASPSVDKISLLRVEPFATKDNPNICMSPDHYENLAVNMQTIIKALKQKNAVIKYYKGCIK